MIYPPPSMAHKELSSFSQFLFQSKGIPEKTSCHSVTHVNLYDAAMKSRRQSTPWPCLYPSDHHLAFKQSSNIKDGG